MNFYYDFYRRYGVRTPQQLMTPVVTTIDKFNFPKDSLYHFLAFDNVQYGPESDNYLFRNVSKQILMDHVLELTDNKGLPKKISAQILPYVREYHMKNRRFRYIKDVAASARDENTLTVINYGFILKIFRYARSLYTEYYRWWNIQKTLWQSVSDISKESDRQQYIFIDLPKTLPSVTTLDNYSNVFNQQLVKTFSTPEQLFLLEMWKWLGKDTRELSVLSTLQEKDFSKVNIVYQDSGKWIMFNLGTINSWRYVKAKQKDEDSSENEVEETKNQKVKISPDQIQRQFLRTLMSFMSYRAVVEDETEEEILDTDTEDEFETKTNQPIIEVSTKEVSEEDPAPLELDDIEIKEETKLQKSERLLKSLDSDLKELEVIENRTQILEENKTIDKTQKTFSDNIIDFSQIDKEVTPEESVLSYCDEMAENGLITAADYKGLIKQSGLYKDIRSPHDSKQTLVEFAKINPEDLVIQKSSEIKDINTVLDKSMLKSSLIDFDERYINKILPKDVSGMVIAIQKAGIILSNYDVEKISDVMGDYEMHTMRVRPVEGIASTIRFKLPVVSENGDFTSNGNKYTMRKQRGD